MIQPPRYDLYQPIYDFVRRVPYGRVVSYGQVADWVTEVRFTPRQVGVAMSVCPLDVPWQRVVGSDGRLLIAKRNPAMAVQQRQKLEAEGVGFTEDGRVDIERYRWLIYEKEG